MDDICCRVHGSFQRRLNDWSRFGCFFHDGASLALGQVLADIPEGYATIANMKAKGVPRARRIVLSASFVLPVLAASALAYFLLRGNTEVWQMSALSFTAGLLTLAAIEDMISEAHEAVEDTSASLMSFTAGFIIFTLVSAGMES